MTKTLRSREYALNLLLEVIEKDAYSNRVIDKVISENNLSGEEKNLFTRLSLGTIENLLFLDFVINHYSKTPVKKQRPIIRNILRMSVYQILFMDRIPDSAVCNEAVGICKKRGLKGLSGFVNGVLRKICSSREDIEKLDVPKYISCNLPKWIYDMWISDYGKAITDDICNGLKQDSSLTLQLYTHKLEKGVWERECKDKGIETEPIEGLPNVYRIQGYKSLADIPGFITGDIYIQDESSIRAIAAAGIKPGMNILDVCGAPGGKSLYAMNLAGGEAKIEIRDISESKEKIVKENIIKSGYNNINFIVWDALVKDEEAVETYDMVIADLPCCGLGVIAKKPEIRYRVTYQSLKELSKLQREILFVVRDYVKPGGRLIYSTCSLSKTENEDNTKAFIEKGGDFKLIDKEMIIPNSKGSDGFYYAIFERRS